jgi:hypothetical protein
MVHTLFWTGSAWTHVAIGTDANAVPASPGSGITSVEHAGAPHVYYIDNDKMIQEIFWSV